VPKGPRYILSYYCQHAPASKIIFMTDTVQKVNKEFNRLTIITFPREGFLSLLLYMLYTVINVCLQKS
jgi:hypothetical protein